MGVCLYACAFETDKHRVCAWGRGGESEREGEMHSLRYPPGVREALGSVSCRVNTSDLKIGSLPVIFSRHLALQIWEGGGGGEGCLDT